MRKIPLEGSDLRERSLRESVCVSQIVLMEAAACLSDSIPTDRSTVALHSMTSQTPPLFIHAIW